MLSFREIQDLIVLSYDDNYISDEEFLLLYDEFESTNLDFPYNSYGEFDLDSMEDDECKAEFRVRKTTTTTTKTLFSTQMEDYKRFVLRVIAGREHKLLRK